MQRAQNPFGKRRKPIAEYKSVEERYEKGELSRRRESNFAIYNTLLLMVLAVVVSLVLIISPESRALALEIGAKAFELGRDWVLRGVLE
ncbi:hypothetical protein EOD10_18350 [Mesorhizobium sp. M7A.T.Ca.TU.009.01.3.2]|uniref:hypothetical protein n=1 Tax=unclassified Mesorhizobium TaxID=325217 RepID=UPI000FCA4D8E|nr:MULTISPECIES: hypothetical protein [unclassified Mesorhizobium]RUU11714.1 hypothetical protein EOD10_18350 [Mesorhizobium sp. M7A.T.Ca.TU.009.01.3.2]RUU58197.1 hypothetical protein EOC99_24350 [Mesorhizobium sp. M7A.T.Ca.TU.009.01.1.1]RUU90181.1 hypothetical protein EOD03_01960 [Mesorhizobium sp. M7A.T.Ca.TU.009.01.1.2]RUV14315.1 hypothetical protein EOD00_01955 [Mesorhizobium sp. M7A.T.Ca.TU.009.01.3.1]AZV18664.1 hypothetical protein EJ079_05885 [Mesorhizobium sp. M7A.F.Ce.TU.012.03.2.1]